MTQNASESAPDALSVPRPPSGLKRSGRALWRAIMTHFEDMDEHELTMVRECCRTADSIDDLQHLLDAEGVMSTSSQGVRVHPALVELRQQRIAYARLMAALDLPAADEADVRGFRGPRGVYGIRGVS
ncbi:MAG: terminase [Actinomycetota bacterium]|nr:terminase [Actinomycetota bacterium]